MKRMTEDNAEESPHPESEDTAEVSSDKPDIAPEWESYFSIVAESQQKHHGQPLKLPTKREAYLLMRRLKLAHNIVNHQAAVMRKALDLAYNITKTEVNIELVKIGALVHDIGRCRTHGMAHGIEGGLLLRKLGYAESLARIAETHSLAGLTRGEAVGFGLPDMDFRPISIEEKLVCLADKYHSGTRRVTIDKRFERWFLKYGETPFLQTQLKRAKALEEEVLRLIF